MSKHTNIFLNFLSFTYVSVSDGKFGAYMQVHIQNDGPVTISLETPPPKPMQQKQVCLLNSILIILFNFWLLPFSSSFLGFSDPGCQRRLCALDSILIGAISVLAHEQALIINASAERSSLAGNLRP